MNFISSLILVSTASDFQRLNNAISFNLNKITNNTSDLEKLVQSLGTQEDSEPLRERYLRLQNETKSLMQQTNNMLKELQNTPAETEADKRQRKNLADNLSKKYMTILKRFQDAQRIGARKEKESLERTRSVSYRPQNIYESQGIDHFSPDNSQQQQQVVIPMEQDVDMEALRERDQQLHQLETNIVEVNELFKDISKIVQEHGEIIDTIDQHIVETETHVDTSNQQLKQAVIYQSAARRKKIMLICILITILVIIALVLALYFGLKKN